MVEANAQQRNAEIYFIPKVRVVKVLEDKFAAERCLISVHNIGSRYLDRWTPMDEKLAQRSYQDSRVICDTYEEAEGRAKAVMQRHAEKERALARSLFVPVVVSRWDHISTKQ